MRNARLDEAQAGIKIAGRNINNLRYADDTTLMIESEENSDCHFELYVLINSTTISSQALAIREP